MSTKINGITVATPYKPGSGSASTGSGVYVGSEEPTDENVMVWVDPAGIPDGESLTAEEVEALIEEKLGVIENGTY